MVGDHHGWRLQPFGLVRQHVAPEEDQVTLCGF
jgi:hypothetical protein